MNLTRSTLTAIALGAIAAGCTQHIPSPPTSPSVPNSSPEMPPPSLNPANTPNTNPNVPPASPTQPDNPSADPPR
jgi:hypothetical protein